MGQRLKEEMTVRTIGGMVGEQLRLIRGRFRSDLRMGTRNDTKWEKFDC